MIQEDVRSAVEQMLSAKAREVAALADIQDGGQRLERAVGRLADLALESADPDPDSMTDDEKESFRRMNSGW